jgi:hypothetical protein
MFDNRDIDVVRSTPAGDRPENLAYACFLFRWVEMAFPSPHLRSFTYEQHFWYSCACGISGCSTVMFSISHFHDKCNESFQELLSTLVAPARDFGDQINTNGVTKEYGRFKVWAGNIGAFHKPEKRISLDHRLRDAPLYRDQVVALLEDLSETNKKGIKYIQLFILVKLIQNKRFSYSKLDGNRSKSARPLMISVRTQTQIPMLKTQLLTNRVCPSNILRAMILPTIQSILYHHCLRWFRFSILYRISFNNYTR